MTMEKLASSIADYAKVAQDDQSAWESISEPERALQVAAEQWAAASLRTYRGKQLKRALAVSAAMVAFLAELERNVFKAEQAASGIPGDPERK
jgi:hypothetical protein